MEKAGGINNTLVRNLRPTIHANTADCSPNLLIDDRSDDVEAEFVLGDDEFEEKMCEETKHAASTCAN